ncbi:hypothetical protein ACHAXS_010736 [Conticribra weissflogii]
MFSMRAPAIAGILLLGFGLPCEAQDGECKSICREIRQEVLKDVSVCLPASQIDPIPKVFKVCIDGRKKAYEHACVSTCTSSNEEFSSFEGCKSVVHKNHGPKFVDWCRKGYESMIVAVESALVQHRAENRNLKQQFELLEDEVEIHEAYELDVELDEQDADNLILHAESLEDTSVALSLDYLESNDFKSSSDSDRSDSKTDDLDGPIKYHNVDADEDKESAKHSQLRRERSHYHSDASLEVYEAVPESRQESTTPFFEVEPEF